MLIGPWGRRDAEMQHPGVRNHTEWQKREGLEGKEGLMTKTEKNTLTQWDKLRFESAHLRS